MEQPTQQNDCQQFPQHGVLVDYDEDNSLWGWVLAESHNDSSYMLGPSNTDHLSV